MGKTIVLLKAGVGIVLEKAKKCQKKNTLPTIALTSTSMAYIDNRPETKKKCVWLCCIFKTY